MINRRKTLESKKTVNNINSVQTKKFRKSISLIVKTPNYSNNTIPKKMYSFIPKTSYSVQTSEAKQSQPKISNNKNNTNIKNFSKLCNFTLYRQNSQGALYSLKKFNHEFLFPDIMHKNQGVNIRLLSEIKSPKFIEYMNNKEKKSKKLNHSQNINDKYFVNKYNYNKSNHNSFYGLNKKNKNLSQTNINLKLSFDEFYDFHGTKDDNINKNKFKDKTKENDENNNINDKKYLNYNRYDKKKCIIERKMYGDNKYNKNKTNNSKKYSDKNSENNTLSGKDFKEYNKYSKYNSKKESKKLEEKIINNYNYNNSPIYNLTQKSKDMHNINISELINYKKSSSKMLLNKSKTNINMLNIGLEEIHQTKINSSNNSNKEYKKRKYNDIKLVFPAFFNKLDINNESSQESTNLIGNTFSNKLTINNSNMITKKEKFINSFLDGPEDIHYRFVDLHRQRKLFYENMCYKDNENQGNIKNKNINNNKAKISDFDKNEYSEYFDNFNEEVPMI